MKSNHWMICNIVRFSYERDTIGDLLHFYLVCFLFLLAIGTDELCYMLTCNYVYELCCVWQGIICKTASSWWVIPVRYVVIYITKTRTNQIEVVHNYFRIALGILLILLVTCSPLSAMTSKASYNQISCNLEATMYRCKVVRLLWNLTGALTAMLLRHLSYFRAMPPFLTLIQGFTNLVARHPVA